MTLFRLFNSKKNENKNIQIIPEIPDASVEDLKEEAPVIEAKESEA